MSIENVNILFKKKTGRHSECHFLLGTWLIKTRKRALLEIKEMSHSIPFVKRKEFFDGRVIVPLGYSFSCHQSHRFCSVSLA